jgi:hypothetical protein
MARSWYWNLIGKKEGQHYVPLAEEKEWVFAIPEGFGVRICLLIVSPFVGRLGSLIVESPLDWLL